MLSNYVTPCVRMDQANFGAQVSLSCGYRKASCWIQGIQEACLPVPLPLQNPAVFLPF